MLFKSTMAPSPPAGLDQVERVEVAQVVPFDNGVFVLEGIGYVSHDRFLSFVVWSVPCLCAL
jgi:hypothetical protein